MNHPPLTDQEAEALAAMVANRERLETLSDVALIREVLQSDVADDERVMELMRRVYPEWDSIDLDAHDDQPRTKNDHIMLRCPHCDQVYEAKIGNNLLVRDGLTITPLTVAPDVASEIEQ